jgi:hypothetical protein
VSDQDETILPPPKTLNERLADARKAKEAIQAAAAERAKELELEALELEERLTRELGGPMGVQFAIEIVPEGCIAVKLGASGLYKRFQSGSLSFEEQYEFIVDQLVYPTRERADQIMGARRGVVTRLSDALIRLHRGDIEALQGKA